jgi:hypothetical protein
MPDNDKIDSKCPYCGLGKPGFDVTECGLPYCSKAYRKKERWYNTTILMAGPIYVGLVMVYLHPEKWFPVGIISLAAMGAMFIIGRVLKCE